jgi:carbonic anhydrase
MTFEEFVAEELGKPGMSMLVACMDYRYPRRIVDAMQRLTPGKAYDQFILAGASLGACRPDWQKVLIEHIEAALALKHDIRRIVILDHRDCGAYRNPGKLKIPKDILEHGIAEDILPSEEKRVHQDVLSKLILMLKKHPKIAKMKFRALLLTRDEDDKLET